MLVQAGISFIEEYYKKQISYNKIMNKNILLIDKEAGWTSFDVVAWVRARKSELQNLKANSKQLKTKVGHAGTLDPFATGLLIVLIGKDATKRQDEFMKQDKEYEATLALGKTSSTGDPEGDVQEIPNHKYQIPNKLQISNVLKSFVGEIEQIPPAHSAIKINGKKAYELARKGLDPKLKSRKVTIFDIKILDYSWPFLTIRVKCGSGTYIRSLAKDIGEALKVGAYLTELRRTKIGKFDVKDAKKVSEINF